MPYLAPQEHLSAEATLFRYFFTTKIVFVVNWQEKPLVRPLRQALTSVSSPIIMFIMVATF
jgi:hypothetical protein